MASMPHASAAAAQAFVDGSTTDKPEELAVEEDSTERISTPMRRRQPRRHRSSGAAEASQADLQGRARRGRRHAGAWPSKHARQSRRPRALAGRVDQDQPAVGHQLEQPPAHHLHRIGGHAALAREAARGGARGHRSGRRSHRRLHRRHRPGPARGGEGGLQRRSRQGAAAHPDLHRCRARRHQPADPLLRPHPLRSALEPVAPGAAQRPHRPQAAAGQAGRSAATSATSSARPTSCSTRWCARPR